MAEVIKEWVVDSVKYSLEKSGDKIALVAYGDTSLDELHKEAQKFGIEPYPLWIGKNRCVAISDKELAMAHASFQDAQLAERLNFED